MAVDSSGRYVAVGGESCNAEVWDLSSSSSVFKAKGGKPDKLGLVDKVNCTVLTFLPSLKPAFSTKDKQEASPPPLTLVSGTASHKLYVYQLAVGRRPQLDLPFGETRVTAIVPDPEGGSQAGPCCWAANGEGIVERLDIEAKKVHGGLKGSTGSVRALAALSLTLHKEVKKNDLKTKEVEEAEADLLPIVASVGLDRYLRVFHSKTRKCLHKLYLKQQLSAVAILLQDVTPPAASQSQDVEEVVEAKVVAEGEKKKKL